jgi:hypothetical protein
MPTQDTALKIWSIDGIAVTRAGYNYGDPEWAPDEAIASKEPLIGGGVYRDTAGTQPGQFSLRIGCDTYAQRESIIAKAGTVVHLQKTNKGYGAYFTLRTATRLQLAGGYFAADLVLE